MDKDPRSTPESREAHRQEMLEYGYSVVPMPLTSDGRGPADSDETAKTVWQVWDAAYLCVLQTESEEEAKWVRLLAEKLKDLRKRVEGIAKDCFYDGCLKAHDELCKALLENDKV